ncbi:hypothetical protein QQF64_004569 [Cirrhinus molitorella]|uniref:Uncharacterized protein n=1 Tax=Cirrhinus molitorella TaxID=172907 RepID=A0ABR3MGL0_9TELE
MQRLKSRLKESYKVAMEKAAKIAHKNKMRYDRHVTASDLEPGDRVLVRNVRIRGKHKISDKWEPTVHVVVRRAGTLPVYTVRPETGDGPLRTLHRDLLFPCGYLPVEGNSEPVQKSVPRRPRTHATPVLEEENSSEEEDDALTFVWSSPPVPVVSESPVYPDLSMTDVPDTQHTEPLGSCLVEGPVHAQNDDNPPEHDTQTDFDNLLDMSQSISDSPLMVKFTSHQSDTEYVLTDRDTPTEQANEPALIQNHSSADDKEEQFAVPSAISDKDEKNYGLKGAKLEEGNEEVSKMDGKDETMDTEENTDTIDPVRRSERNRQPPRRLDYTELGSPLIIAVKSFFQELSTAWAGDISGEPVQLPTPSPRIIVI